MAASHVFTLINFVYLHRVQSGLVPIPGLLDPCDDLSTWTTVGNVSTTAANCLTDTCIALRGGQSISRSFDLTGFSFGAVRFYIYMQAFESGLSESLTLSVICGGSESQRIEYTYSDQQIHSVLVNLTSWSCYESPFDVRFEAVTILNTSPYTLAVIDSVEVYAWISDECYYSPLNECVDGLSMYFCDFMQNPPMLVRIDWSNCQYLADSACSSAILQSSNFSSICGSDMVELPGQLSMECCSPPTTAPTVSPTNRIAILGPIARISDRFLMTIAIIGAVTLLLALACIIYLVCLSKLHRRVREPGNGSIFQTVKTLGTMGTATVLLGVLDAVTDYLYSVSLITSSDADLQFLGWIALSTAIVGALLFLIQFLLNKKLIGFQERNLRTQIRQTSNASKVKQMMEQIRIRRVDMAVFNLLIACVEDVPQSVIVSFTVVAGYAEGWNILSLLSFSMSVISFCWKFIQIIAAKAGCSDPNNTVMSTQNESGLEGAGAVALALSSKSKDNKKKSAKKQQTNKKQKLGKRRG